jgi:hypothetical protein
VEVTIRYPHHPRCGTVVVVVRTHRRGGVLHLVTRQPDGTLALLPAWMTESASASSPLVDQPRLPLATLRALGALLGAIMHLATNPAGGEISDEATRGEPAGSLYGGAAAGRGTGVGERATSIGGAVADDSAEQPQRVEHSDEQVR